MLNLFKVAPMLRELGYDPDLNPPNYGVPDPEVINNTLDINANR
jgi:protein-tyrosine sulfotransferase